MSMRRKPLLLLLALVVVVVIVVVYLLGTPEAPIVEKSPPPPAVKPPSPLQADAEGSYVPGYQFSVNQFRFTGFTLHPDAFVTFARTPSGTEESVACLEARIRPETVHLRCDDPQVGTVTVDGRFLTRFATSQLDAAVLTAVVTVRDGSGEVLYRAQDSFQWQPGK